MWKGVQAAALAAVLSAAQVLAAEPAAAERITLDEAIEGALLHNLDLAQSARDVQGNRLAAEAAQVRVVDFQVAPEGAAGATDAGGDWQGGLRAGVTVPTGARLEAVGLARQIEVEGAADLRRQELRVEISQPLFRNFGPLVRNEPAVAADETWRAARRAWERERSGLAVRVAECYESLIRLRRQIERDEAFAARIERLWALADARERQGRTERTEVMRLDLQRGEAQMNLEARRAQLDIRSREFADLLGRPLDAVFLLVPPPLLDLDLPGPEQALATAMAGRPDYAQALDDILTADRQVLLARRDLWPDLSLTARHSTYGEGGDWSDAGRLDQEDWFVGIVGDVNLNRRSARLDAERSELEAEGRRQVAELVRRQLAMEVHEALTQYRRDRSELVLAGRNRELAANRAEVASALYEAGRGSADTVSDAEADLLDAELSELGARQAASLAAYRLLHVLGRLVPASPELLAGGPG